MDRLNDILNAFSTQEKEQLLHLASARNTARSKKLDLLRLLIRNPHEEDDFFAKRLYPNHQSNAFPQLKKRLKEEIKEISVLIKPSSVNTKAHQRIRCSELILQSQLLLARNLRDEGSKLLQKSLELAIEGGFHDLALTVFSIGQEYGSGHVLSTKDLPELELAIKCHLQVLVSQSEIHADGKLHSSNRWLRQMIQKLNANRKQWGLVSSLKNSIQKRDYEEASLLMEQVESEEFSEPDDYSALCEFLHAKLQLLFEKMDFLPAQSLCEEYLQSKLKNQEVPSTFFQYYFLSLFHQKKWDEALQVIHQKLNGPELQKNPHWEYWKALTFFSLEKYKPALKLIHDCQSRLKSVPDYYLGSKMLELMILFEQKDMDWLEYKMENFRKLLSRWSHKASIRLNSAFHLLSDLHQHTEVERLLESSLWEKLNQRIGEYKWRPDGFELLPYDQWFYKNIVK